MQTLIVILIVALAAYYLIRRFYKSIHPSSPPACGCGCEGCGADQKKQQNTL